MENIQIMFEIKSTNNIDICYLNTLILQLDNLRTTMENGVSNNKLEIEGYNEQIEKMIKTLEVMKIKPRLELKD